MVTCGTYLKAHTLNTPAKLNFFRDLLFATAIEYGWSLHAWAILINHYHFIASSPVSSQSLKNLISKVHTLSAKEFNLQDGTPKRRVWFQYFDSHITFTNSYLPRLKYVHNNPKHHCVVDNAEKYPWCSAAWFASTAKPAFRSTVEQFKTDRLSVMDEFDSLSARSPIGKSGVEPPHSK